MRDRSTEAAPNDKATASERRYLAVFLHRHLDFRRAEIEALAGLTGAGRLHWEQPIMQPLSPFWYVWLPGDTAAQRIAQRALLLKGFLEVWGEGATWQELCEAVRARLSHQDSTFFRSDVSWKVNVDGWGCTIEDPRRRLEDLAFLGFQGPVRLEDPDVCYRLIKVCSDGTSGLPPVPTRWYLGREVAMTQRRLIARYRLPERRYLGPTSMDTEMAFLIANQAQVKRGQLVYDPFVGTGSMLIAAAHFGAVVMGADIDARVIRIGKTDKEGRRVNLWTNFADYGLAPPVGLLRADAHTTPFRAGLEEIFDAVLADPPYGVRAGARKSVSKPFVPRPPDVDHFPATAPYTLDECVHDLLEMAARLLRIGGKLVYFLPIAAELTSQSGLPTHPFLSTVAVSEQMLSDRYSRRLITMQKVSSYDAKTAAASVDLGPSTTSCLRTLIQQQKDKSCGKDRRHRGKLV